MRVSFFVAHRKIEIVEELFMRKNRAIYFVLIVAAALVTPLARADLVGFESVPTWTLAEQPSEGARMLAVNQQIADTPRDTLRILSATSGSAFRLNAASQTFASSLPDIGLWKFISTVRAQQTGTNLVLLESNLRILDSASTAAPIPLPAAAWFMVTGLLTFLGLTAQRRRARLQAAHAPLNGMVSA